jgi:hypothetical protein
MKRRNVFKVGAAGRALAWVAVQLTSILAPAMHLPDWTMPLLANESSTVGAGHARDEIGGSRGRGPLPQKTWNHGHGPLLREIAEELRNRLAQWPDLKWINLASGPVPVNWQ